MRIAALLLLIAFSSASFGADRSEKIRQLMEAQGLLQTFQEQMAMGRKAARDQADQMLDQITKSLKPPEKFDDQFRAAMKDYVHALDAPWTAQDIVDAWAQIYGAKFTDDELDGLLTWYTSPLGRKDTSVSQASISELLAHFHDLSKPIIQRETQRFLDRMKKIIEECNCRTN